MLLLADCMGDCSADLSQNRLVHNDYGALESADQGHIIMVALDQEFSHRVPSLNRALHQITTSGPCYLGTADNTSSMVPLKIDYEKLITSDFF